MKKARSGPCVHNDMPAVATIGYAIAFASDTSVTGSGWAWLAGAAAGFPNKLVDEDYQLVSDCLAGNEAAWEELVRVHTKRVYAVCYRFTGSSEEAQDLTQDVFLRVFRTLRSFRAGEGSFAVWLNRLTRN